MTEPNLDEQIQLILRDFDNAVSIYTIEVKARYETAKAQIQEIIANQVREARIDELERVKRYAGAWFRGDERLVKWIHIEIVDDRIAELQSTLGDKE